MAEVVDILLASSLHAGVAVTVAQILDNVVPPASVSKDGSYLDKPALQETAEVLGQFYLSIWGLEELLDFLLPAGGYVSPITNALAYVLLFQFQPKLAFKAGRLVSVALTQVFGDRFARIESASANPIHQ
jgi:hypothetical protein